MENAKLVLKAADTHGSIETDMPQAAPGKTVEVRRPYAFSTELSLVWAQNHPDLFIQAVVSFQKKSEGYNVSIDASRSGFLTLRARTTVEDDLSARVMAATEVWLKTTDKKILALRKEILRALLTSFGVDKVKLVKSEDQLRMVGELVGLVDQDDV